MYELALRGAQIILLTQHAASDVFLVDYIEDLRRATKNQLIYAEQVDLSSLHSVRKFATKWVDNAPPRRLDMIILCANTARPSAAISRPRTVDGLDEDWQINYLANFHLLSILSPALRAQPPDRDVRIIFATCPGYARVATFDLSQVVQDTSGPGAGSGAGSSSSPARLFQLSKLSLMIFAQSFQKHLNAYARPDKCPPNARVLLVDPGFTRTPGTRRWLTGGSLRGLAFYLATWPLWWLVLKSPEQGAQSFLYAAMEARYGRGKGGWLIKDCRLVREPPAAEQHASDSAASGPAGGGDGGGGGSGGPPVWEKIFTDDKVAAELWRFSESLIQEREKAGAIRRAKEKEMANSAKHPSAKPSPAAEDRPAAAAGTGSEASSGSRRSRKARNKNQDLKQAA